MATEPIKFFGMVIADSEDDPKLGTPIIQGSYTFWVIKFGCMHEATNHWLALLTTTLHDGEKIALGKALHFGLRDALASLEAQFDARGSVAEEFTPKTNLTFMGHNLSELAVIGGWEVGTRRWVVRAYDDAGEGCIARLYIRGATLKQIVQTQGATPQEALNNLHDTVLDTLEAMGPYSKTFKL